MEVDLVQEISKLEKQADGIIEEAKRKAKELEAQAEEEIARLKRESEKEFELRARDLQLHIQSQRQKEEYKRKEEFEKALAHTKQLDRKKLEEVVEFIVKKIYES